MYFAMAFLVGLAGAMEVSSEPVAIVVKYPNMQDISLTPDDVLLYSEDIPQVETVESAPVVYAQRSMAEMVAANIPEPPPESQSSLPNESRKKKRLDHTPPFSGTVTGDIEIIKSGPQERIIVVSNIKGDGIMQVLIKGGTAKTSRGTAAKPVLNTPKVLVRNTKAPTKVQIGGAAESKAAPSLEAGQLASLQGHFKGNPPQNLRIVAEPVTVE